MSDLYKKICIAIALCALCFGAYSLYKIGTALEKNAIANQHIATAMIVQRGGSMYYTDFSMLSFEGLSVHDALDILYIKNKGERQKKLPPVEHGERTQEEVDKWFNDLINKQK